MLVCQSVSFGQPRRIGFRYRTTKTDNTAQLATPGAKRNAQVQQSGSFDDHRPIRSAKHLRRKLRFVGGEHRTGLSRGEEGINKVFATIICSSQRRTEVRPDGALK